MNRCVDMFYVPYFSLHHQYKLSEFLGFCKTPKNVGYIFSASGGSLNTCRLLHKHSKALTPPGPMQARELPQRTSLSFFFWSPAPISSFLRGKRRRLDAGFVMIRKLFKLSYLTAGAPKLRISSLFPNMKYNSAYA